ncbi:collectrin isoform X2 [Marmota marmota marmota]|uniref:collectrin isoform X2 n=1 Tax=Marmota marmota marmota TaxID=9994 RepID=UPI0020920EB3|nr:collectrin isoform X2 [Marmota marmota marmota]
MNRNRINNVFFLNDQTLEFLKIPSTIAPPMDPPVPIWIIIFGVIFCIVIVAITLLVLSGIRQRRRLFLHSVDCFLCCAKGRTKDHLKWMMQKRNVKTPSQLKMASPAIPWT